MTQEAPFYKSGGTLAGDAPSYVTRQADQDLLDSLLNGEFCYVLTSRQMGKSSLVSRCRIQLRERGVQQAVLDLQRFGTNLKVEQWYNGLLSALAEDLDLEDEIEDFMDDHADLGAHQLWLDCLRRVVLERIEKPVVIFVDEIDIVRALDFGTDEFFAGIRELYNRRSADPELRRLTFCLLGVASPASLIHDKRITPFNIGKRINLVDFQPEEMRVFSQGLKRFGADQALAAVDRVAYWTGGQPYLSQRLCQEVAERGETGQESEVDDFCQRLFLSKEGREGDPNLTFVRDRILGTLEEREPILHSYRDILNGRTVIDDAGAPHLGSLKLSGVVKIEEGRLAVKNRIYEQVFNKEFVKRHMPVNWQRVVQRAALWLGGVFLFACLPVAIWALHQRSAARADLENARIEVAEAYNVMQPILRNDTIDRMESELSRLEGLFADAPDHPNMLFSKGRLSIALGNMYEGAGRTEEAVEKFQETAKIMRNLKARGHETERSTFELSAALNELGGHSLRQAQANRGELEEAGRYFEESRQVLEPFSDKPGLGPWLYSIALQHLSDVARNGREHDEAKRLLDESLVYRKRLVDRAPNEGRSLWYLNQTYERIGLLNKTLEKYPESMTAFQAASDAMKHAFESEPDTVRWGLEYGRRLTQWAEVAELADDQDLERELYEKALDVRRRVADRFPDSTSARSDLSDAYRRLALVASNDEEKATWTLEEWRVLQGLHRTRALDNERESRYETLKAMFENEKQ